MPRGIIGKRIKTGSEKTIGSDDMRGSLLGERRRGRGLNPPGSVRVPQSTCGFGSSLYLRSICFQAFFPRERGIAFSPRNPTWPVRASSIRPGKPATVSAGARSVASLQP